MVIHLLVTARTVDLFIGNTSRAIQSLKYTTCVTEMLKNYTLAETPVSSTRTSRQGQYVQSAYNYENDNQTPLHH